MNYVPSHGAGYPEWSPQSSLDEVGKTLMKVRFEFQYSIIKPDSFGTTWNFRFQLTPRDPPSPFAR